MKFTNIEKAFVLIWLVLCFIPLLVNGHLWFYGLTSSASGNFWYHYDLSEFSLYGFVPILLFIAYKLMTAKRNLKI
ncbi:hypothetical protein ACFL0J_04380 [Candidatus Neomarinimicrobiota bacterium]